jgi:SAM-dependent methyltransferase
VKEALARRTANLLGRRATFVEGDWGTERFSLRRILALGAGEYLFPDCNQYLNPNSARDSSLWFTKLLLLSVGRACFRATLCNYRQEETAGMDGYEMQAANWSLSRRRKHWHIQRERAWELVRNTFRAKARGLLKLAYMAAYRLLAGSFALILSRRKLQFLSDKEQVRPFLDRYQNRVGFVLNDFLVHTLLNENERFIQRPSLEIGVANGEAPRLMHGNRVLDAGMEFLPFWPLWGKPRGNFRNFEDRILSADAAAIPFKDGAFNTVIMVNVLAHCMRLDQTLQDLRRILKPGGHLIANMMSDDSWKYTYFVPSLLRRMGSNPLLRFCERLYRPLCRKELIDSKVNLKYHLKTEERWGELFSTRGFSTIRTIRYDADTFWVTRLFFYGFLEPMINLGFKFDLNLPIRRAADIYAALADRELGNIHSRKGEGNSVLFILKRNGS